MKNISMLALMLIPLYKPVFCGSRPSTGSGRAGGGHARLYFRFGIILVFLGVSGAFAAEGKFGGAVVQETEKINEDLPGVVCNRQPDPWTRYRPIGDRFHWNNSCGCPASCCGYRCCGGS